MEIIRNKFIDIHYEPAEYVRAEAIARRLEQAGYSREYNGPSCMQLLITNRLDEKDVEKEVRNG